MTDAQHADPVRLVKTPLYDVVDEVEPLTTARTYTEDDFVREYVNRYHWGWCEPIPGVVAGYGVYDDDEDDPPIFECHDAFDAEALVRVMRWVKHRIDGGSDA